MLHSYFWGPASSGRNKKMKTMLFHYEILKWKQLGSIWTLYPMRLLDYKGCLCTFFRPLNMHATSYCLQGMACGMSKTIDDNKPTPCFHSSGIHTYSVDRQWCTRRIHTTYWWLSAVGFLIRWVINHVTWYKFDSSHWLKLQHSDRSHAL